MLYDENAIVFPPDADMVLGRQAIQDLWKSASDSGVKSLDLTLDDELRDEGVARELVRLVNDRRKADGLDLADRIRLTIHADGSSEPLEGVFINKTAFESPTDKGVTVFGLGVIGKGLQVGGLNIDKIFYQLKQ